MNRPHKTRQNNITWSEEEVQTLITLWNQDVVVPDIADALKKTDSAIRSFITRNRDWLGIEQRPANFKRPKRKAPEERHRLTGIDKEWLGCVPFGHWTVTKRWSNNGSAQRK